MIMARANHERIRAFKAERHSAPLISRIRYQKADADGLPKERTAYLAIPLYATLGQLEAVKKRFFTEGGILGRAVDYIDVPWDQVPIEGAVVLLLNFAGPYDQNWDDPFEVE